MPFVVKAALGPDAASGAMSFDEKTMYRGKDLRIGDEIFVFASDHQGGQGLCARATVTEVERGPGIRLRIKVNPIATAKRRLGRAELKSFRGLDGSDPRTEIDWKLYRQATNKIAGVSDEAAAFLMTCF
ncbi:MAG TPA: hypothetical protein VM689_10955 [Aliidongia sp.]|nr:hypothetical protein [Aliidongia sp.]